MHPWQLGSWVESMSAREVNFLFVLSHAEKMEQAEDAVMQEAEQGGQTSADAESVSVDPDTASVTASAATSSTTSNKQFDVVDSRRRPPTAHEKKVEEKKELEKKLKG